MNLLCEMLSGDEDAIPGAAFVWEPDESFVADPFEKSGDGCVESVAAKIGAENTVRLAARSGILFFHALKTSEGRRSRSVGRVGTRSLAEHWTEWFRSVHWTVWRLGEGKGRVGCAISGGVGTM